MKNPGLLLLLSATLASSLSSQVLGARALTAGGNQVTASARSDQGGPTLTGAPVNISRRFEEWDGFTITKLVLTFDRGASIALSQQRLGDWQRQDRAPFAIAFMHPSAPEAWMGVNHFSGQAAAQLLAGTVWTSAPSSLSRPAKSATRVLVNDDSRLNSNMLRPLSWRTRVFEREITPEEAGTPPQRQILVAIGDDTQAYLFTLEGNAGHVTRLKDMFERMVTAFELVSN